MQLSHEDCELRDAVMHVWDLVGRNAEIRGSDFESEAFLRNYVPRTVHYDELALRVENDGLMDAVVLKNAEISVLKERMEQIHSDYAHGTIETLRQKLSEVQAQNDDWQDYAEGLERLLAQRLLTR